MASILKVNTIRPESGTSITIGADGEAVVNNSPSLTRQGTSANPITFTVTVAAKTSANVYNGAGSSSAYFIDGQQAPSILVEGNESASYEYYYKFDQSDNSNSGHPLLFYLDAAKGQIFSTNVTTNGTPGSSGAYTQIKIGGSTPHVLYYQCSSHSLMGNKLINPATKTLNLSGAAITLPTGTGNADQVIKVASTSNGISTLTFGSSVTFPTIGSISPTVIENTQTAVTITGTNFQSIPTVDAINASTGAITTADSVTFTSATTIVATFTLSVDGTYYLRAENNDGLAVRSSNALLTVSDAPAWTTAAGSLGTVAAAGTVNFTVAATNATSFAKTSGSFPGGVSINASTGVISGTESGSTASTTYTFTIRATDAEGQTADRQFTITISHGATGGGQFN